MVSVIRQGDALEILKTFDAESIDCCITSPPYYALRDYSRCQCTNGKIKVRSDYATHYKIAHRGGENSHMSKPDPTCPKCNGLGVNSAVASSQIGLEETIPEYINKLTTVFDEVKRVLKKEGTCWVVIGDTYSSSDRAGGGYGKKYAELSIDYKQTTPNIPAKSLCMIPERLSIAMLDRGWILRNKICWQKPNCIPQSARDRFTMDWEYFYFFSKSQKYYFEQQYEDRSEQRPWGKRTLVKYNENRNDGGLEYDANTVSHSRIKRSVWRINKKAYISNGTHFAVFPEKLIETPIRAGCTPGGLVLDPFCGSGTTGVVAFKNARKFVGIELNPEYIKLAEKRLEPWICQQLLVKCRLDQTSL